MKPAEFRILVMLKEYTLKTLPLLEFFPNKDKSFKDRFTNTLLETLELTYYANLVGDINLRKAVLSKLSMLDFYLEYAYKNKYLSSNQVHTRSKELNVIVKMVHGWIKNGSNNT